MRDLLRIPMILLLVASVPAFAQQADPENPPGAAAEMTAEEKAAAALEAVAAIKAEISEACAQ